MNSEQSDEKVRGYVGLRNECSLHAISKLQKLAVEEPQIAERISSLASDYRLDMLSTLAYTPQVEDVARIAAQASAFRLVALQMEADAIAEAEEEDEIDALTAREMHRTVAMIRFDAEEMI